MNVTLDHTFAVITATAVLHNILRRAREELPQDDPQSTVTCTMGMTQSVKTHAFRPEVAFGPGQCDGNGISTEVDCMSNSINSLPVIFPYHTLHCFSVVVGNDDVCLARSREVVAGEHSLNNNDGTEQTVAVAQAIVHPNYAGEVGPYDIAVLKLSSALVFNDYVQSIALPPAGSIPSGSAILTGWGSTSQTNNPSMPDILQTATLPIVEYDECVRTYGEDSPLDPTNVCTGPLSGGMSACSGDSGGPLAVKRSDGTFELIGIVSWGEIPCGQSNAPSVYTRVSAYIDWINNNAK
ncbi:hypothetical protein ANN_13942 [Periplaneta americana]|uniref:Peptidase S1 domain-containing protein n=1 Tax=Periplaneta americana TaxID=6978 RepID=A0ABQ8SVY0_PERAM|nr:hypothetical protein ANN_13942 [Periplaneta americana]